MTQFVLFYKPKFGGRFFHGHNNQYKVKIGKLCNNKFYQWIGYNKFHKDGKTMNWDKITIPKHVVITFINGNKIKQNKELFKLFKKKHYFTFDNGGLPFCVYISNKRALIYKEFKKDDFMYDWFNYLKLPENARYTLNLFNLKFQKVYVGKSPKNSWTEFSGGYGNNYDGNTIVLKISDNKYIFIGARIVQFSLQKGDKIKKYWSPVGNSSVSFPFITGVKYVYFLGHDFKYISKEKLFKNVDMTGVDPTNLYDVLFSYKKQKQTTKMKIKVLEKRQY